MSELHGKKAMNAREEWPTAEKAFFDVCQMTTIVDYPGYCEDCNGPANWTLIRGQMYYYCVNQCDGFMQMEMRLEDRDEHPRYDGPDRRAPSPRGFLARVLSGDLSVIVLPILALGRRLLRPRSPSLSWIQGSPSRYRFRSQDRSGALKDRLGQLADLVGQGELEFEQSDGQK